MLTFHDGLVVQFADGEVLGLLGGVGVAHERLGDDGESVARVVGAVVAPGHQVVAQVLGAAANRVAHSPRQVLRVEEGGALQTVKQSPMQVQMSDFLRDEIVVQF